jgi:exonuclease VII large subunit
MSNSDYTLEDLVTDSTADLQNIGSELASETTAEMQDALEKAGHDLKKSLEKLEKSIKKEVRSEVLNYYHDNKKLIDSDLKELNAFIKDVLWTIKEELREEIRETDDKDERKLLKEMRNDVVRFTRKYNHKYHKLRLKLAFGNAGMDIKNFFN